MIRPFLSSLRMLKFQIMSSSSQKMNFDTFSFKYYIHKIKMTKLLFVRSSFFSLPIGASSLFVF